MAPDQDFETSAEQPETPTTAEAPRTGRRPGRGRRGRGRRRKRKLAPGEVSPSSVPESGQADEVGESSSAATEEGDTEGPTDQNEATEFEDRAADVPPAEEPRPPAPPEPARPGPVQRASKASVQEAIEEVSQIMATLRETLDQMDEVLEMLEDFERQGDADEREIESLRRALRQLQRPREGGPAHRGRH